MKDKDIGQATLSFALVPYKNVPSSLPPSPMFRPKMRHSNSDSLSSSLRKGLRQAWSSCSSDNSLSQNIAITDNSLIKALVYEEHHRDAGQDENGSDSLGSFLKLKDDFLNRSPVRHMPTKGQGYG